LAFQDRLSHANKQRHLEVLDAIITAESISRAAAQLNLSQPAVCIALANFEDSIGFRLFQRNRGFFAPTPKPFCYGMTRGKVY